MVVTVTVVVVDIVVVFGFIVVHIRFDKSLSDTPCGYRCCQNSNLTKVGFDMKRDLSTNPPHHHKNSTLVSYKLGLSCAKLSAT